MRLFHDAGYWESVKDGNVIAAALFEQHYSKYHYADGRKPKLFVGPGEKLVLLGKDQLALFVWRRFISKDGQIGLNNSIFINQGTHLSSEIILEAEAIALNRWPGIRFYTYVNPKKVKSPNPGYCYKCAGWRQCGITKKRKHLIFEKLN
jgi:hypothetical protein